MRIVRDHTLPPLSDAWYVERAQLIKALATLDVEAPGLIKAVMGRERDAVRVTLTFMAPMRFDGQGALKAYRRTNTYITGQLFYAHGRCDERSLCRAIEALAAGMLRKLTSVKAVQEA